MLIKIDQQSERSNFKVYLENIKIIKFKLCSTFYLGSYEAAHKSILQRSFRIEQEIGSSVCTHCHDHGSSFTPPKAARGSAAAHHAQRVALVGHGPAA
jgi:hypothetical protein